MKLIQVLITACLIGSGFVTQANASDKSILDMAQAFKKNDSKALARLLPSAKGHVLEPWAAYWELRARLPDASFGLVDAFLKRYAGTYQEDRLRADWLLLLGERRDWQAFSDYFGAYRMRDDKDILCYAQHIAFVRTGAIEAAQTAQIAQSWLQQKTKNTGCGFVAEALIDSKQMDSVVAWRKSYKGERLPADATAQQRNWAYGYEGKELAQKLDMSALSSFAQISDPADLSSDMRAWWIRAALRAQDWRAVLRVSAAMTQDEQTDPAWQYWRARATEDLQGYAQAKLLYERLAQDVSQSAGFYQQLARERLGIRLDVSAQPMPIAGPEALAARGNAGLARALAAIQMGLRSEGVREWNYETNLASGSMTDRQRLAVAAMACAQQVWDRCINTSERTKLEVDWSQRFPLPYAQVVISTAQQARVNPAYAYGLMRQESRFIADAASSVGAKGLMQVMPATARWTAKKIGLTRFDVGQMQDVQTNVTIGMAYLATVLTEFDSQAAPALAAAAYNAGPSRARGWRKSMTANGALETAIWVENIPFLETRDYVKKVLANAVIYAALYPKLRPVQGAAQTVVSEAQTLSKSLGLMTVPAANLPASDTP